MALEIMDGRLLYDQHVKRPSLNLDNFNPNLFQSHSTLRHRHDVMYNYLHDAESLCWVHLWILLSRIPHLPSQTLGNEIFQNARVPSPSRRRVFLDGFPKEEIGNVHPSVRHLVTMWDLTREELLDVFQSALLDDRTDSMYADVYVSLYVLCFEGSKAVGVPGLPSG